MIVMDMPKCKKPYIRKLKYCQDCVWFEDSHYGGCVNPERVEANMRNSFRRFKAPCKRFKEAEK